MFGRKLSVSNLITIFTKSQKIEDKLSVDNEVTNNYSDNDNTNYTHDANNIERAESPDANESISDDQSSAKVKKPRKPRASRKKKEKDPNGMYLRSAKLIGLK